jgi:transcriptional regulator with XRE-family HTH domain
MSFGKNLQAQREKAGLSQSELAAKTGISVKSLQNWEIDRYVPRADAIVKLAEALGVDVGVLMRAATEPKPRGQKRGRP